jgi:glyoxylase I family protein
VLSFVKENQSAPDHEQQPEEEKTLTLTLSLGRERGPEPTLGPAAISSPPAVSCPPLIYLEVRVAGKNSAIGGGGFHHIAMNARDFDRSVAFYTKTLGFTPKITWGEAPKRAVMLDTGDGNYLEIFERPDLPAPGEGHLVHFALRTTDCDAALARARAAGAPVTMEPKSLEIPSTPRPTPVRIAFCKGPEGEVIEFFQNR